MSLERFFSYPSQTADYVSNVSDRFKYFYLANPKAASTGILRTLQLAEVDGNIRSVPASVHNRLDSPLRTISSSRSTPDEILAGLEFFRFTYVRNPFTRVLSAYLEKIVQEQSERARLLPTLGLAADAEVSFLKFLEAIRAQRDGWRDIHWTTQARLTQCNNISYHFIGRFESFSSTFPHVLERLGISASHLKASGAPMHATNANSRILEYIGPKERELIITIYESDFQAFGYGLDHKVAHL